MKRILSFMFVCVILCALSACGGNPAAQDAEVQEKTLRETTQETEQDRPHSTLREVRYEEGSSYGISAVVEGPAPVNNKYGNHFYPAETPVVLVDNDV